MFTSLPLFCGLLLFGCTPSRNLSGPQTDSLLLAGAWEVTGQTVSPLRIIPHCNAIGNGTTFLFIHDTLKVYTDTSRLPCDVFRYKTTTNTISFIKADMIWIATYQLHAGTLTLQSDTFFTPDDSAKSKPVARQPGPMQGITVTLKKRTHQTN